MERILGFIFSHYMAHIRLGNKSIRLPAEQKAASINVGTADSTEGVAALSSINLTKSGNTSCQDHS